MQNRFWIPFVIVLIIVALFAYVAIDGPNMAGRIAYAVAKSQNDAGRAELSELAKQDHMSDLFAQVASVLRPAVVEVRVAKRVSVQELPDVPDLFRRQFGDPFGQRGRSRPQPQQPPRDYYSRGLGSGVIVDAKNGYVITNNHVVVGADEIQVVLHDGRSFKTHWVRTDPQTDLAVLKVEAEGLIDGPLGDSDKMRVGDWVLAIGSPEGLDQTVTAGIISAMGRTTGEANSYQAFLQTDAAINHGNSGGPLVNMRGEVIGINSAIVSQTGVNEGIGLAIPSNMVKHVMQQLIEKGKVTRGYLGVSIQNVDDKLAKSFNLPDTKGALVTDVVSGGPAAKAGLKEGDFIVNVGGTAIKDVNELRNAVAALPTGKDADLEIYRDGKKMTVTVRVDPQPADMALAMRGTKPDQEVDTPSRLGIDVSDMTPALAQQFGYKAAPKGVIITNVTPGSNAESSGLEAGMVITQAGGKDVSNVDDFKKLITGKEGVRIRVTGPGGGSRFVFLPAENGNGKEKPK